MSKVEEEIAMVLGGQFNVASIGPEAVEALQAKIRRRPNVYIGALRETAMGDAFDPRRHADLHIAALLEILREKRPEEVDQIAATLLRLYDGVLVPFDGAPNRDRLYDVMHEETVNMMFRLNTRRLELRALRERIAGGGTP
jgi:hypothetical protein